ncbi:hypothetical protein [Tolumonas lignilytica]|nr:hypothetical protein [Tolumonas lignilytica]
MLISDQILDQLPADCKSPKDLRSEQGLLRQLTKKLAGHSSAKQSKIL